MTDRFELSPEFISQFIGKQPAWGPVGYVTYKRTYARDLETIYPRHRELGINAGLKTNEEFWLTLTRVVEGTFSILAKHCLALHLPWSWDRAQGKAQEMFRLMWDFKFLPPGRGLWMMGAPVVEKVGGAALNNCGFQSSENIDTDFAAPFCALMDFSMLGVGVGGDTRGAGKLTIQEPKRSDRIHVVTDTREGWVEVLRIVLEAYVGIGYLPKFDYSLVRAAGSPIKGFGGVASGPDPLREMVTTICELLNARANEKITSSDIVDIFNLVGKCVVSGNVRRSAEIMFGEPTDEGFLELKDKEKHGAALDSHRWASNNSIFASVGQNYTRQARLTAKNGEPGYFWLANAQDYGRMIDPPNFRDKRAKGGNPCLPADVIVMTDKGPRRIKELIGQPFRAVVDGVSFESKIGFFETGTQQVFRLQTTEGHSVRLTANHKVLTAEITRKAFRTTWKRADELVEGDSIVLNNLREMLPWGGFGTFDGGWLLGSMVGDGCFYRAPNKPTTAKVEFWGPDRDKMLAIARARIETLGGPQHYHSMRHGTVTDERDRSCVLSKRLYELAITCGLDETKKFVNESILLTSADFHRGFLRGYFDADGTVIGSQEKGVSVRLSSVSVKNLELVQRMLLNLGINSSIYRGRAPAGMRLMPDGKGGHAEYMCQESNELCIARDNLFRFRDVVGFEEPAKVQKLDELLAGYVRTPNRERFVARVASLEAQEIEPVYDCTVEEVHRFGASGIVVHNCLEQTLWDGELCNLVETFPTHHANLKEYLRTIKFAYLYAKVVTLVPTHNAKTNAVTLKNRRIGCSMSGIVQAIEKFGRRKFFGMCDDAYAYIQQLDEQYSDWMCVPRSIKTTSVKPSGTVSLLPKTVTPGMHHLISEHYWRVIRFATDSAMLPALRAAGYMCIEVDPAKEPNTTAVYFPVKVDNFSRAEKDVSMWEQLELAADLQAHWADNQVSVTVKFDKKTEGPQIARALEIFETRLKGVSFLPHEDHGYDHAPYQPITKAEYEAAVEALRPLDLTGAVNETQERFCDTDKCALPTPQASA